MLCFVETIFTRTFPACFSQLYTDTTRLRATPSISPWIQPGARISTVTFSPLSNASGTKGRRTVPKSRAGFSSSLRPNSFSQGRRLRL